MQQLLTDRNRLPRFSGEWKKKRFGDVCTFLPTANNPRADLEGRGNVGYIHYGNVHAHPLPVLDCGHHELPRIKEHRIGNASWLRDGDLVMVDASEDLAGLGKSVEVLSTGSDKIVAGLHTILCRGRSGHWAPGFKSYLQYIPAFRSALTRMASGISVYAISRKQLADIVLALPSPSEQVAIVAVLSDVDGLIESLEVLIAKKRAVKTATMQQLLTGRTRLAGFSGSWSEKTLGSLAVVVMGQSPSSMSYNSHGKGLPLIQGNADIENRRTIDRVWTTQASKVCSFGDLLLTVRAPVGYVAVASRTACLGRGVCGLKPCCDSAFLFYALLHAENCWQSFEQGSTFTAANSEQIRQFRLRVPDERTEQGAIAAVLSDIDAEIVALERRLAKVRALEQGAMQQLLTGRIRLPASDAPARPSRERGAEPVGAAPRSGIET